MVKANSVYAFGVNADRVVPLSPCLKAQQSFFYSGIQVFHGLKYTTGLQREINEHGCQIPQMDAEM